MDLDSSSLLGKNATLLPLSLNEEEAHSVGNVVAPTKVVYDGPIVALHSVEGRTGIKQSIYMVHYSRFLQPHYIM